MPKANIKLLFLILLPLTATWITGCTTPEEKKNRQLEEATTLHAQGDNAAALTILEALAEAYPNDAEILRHIGQIYSEQGDATLAAFYLEQAHIQAPDNIELLYQTYLAVKAAEQPTGELLEKLATREPGAMPPALWIELAQYRQSLQKTQPALDAYLKGVNPDQATPAANVSAAIGQLFIELDNLPQAERWLTMAADSDSPDALTALFGLLEIKLRNKDWSGAEETLKRLDQQFPGAVDASEWASARTELKEWRDAQAAMQAQLKKEEAVTQTAKKSNTPPTDGESSGKAEVIADLEAAEAMANMPAIEVESAEEGKTTLSADAPVAYNPAISIQPADPDALPTVSYSEERIGGPASVSMGPAPTTSTQPRTIASTPAPSAPNLSLSELMEQAAQAETERDYTLAISSYWQALGQANQRADIWNLLSRAYLVDGQLKNAETTALEAIRLAPKEVSYTLDYLRVAQRSKKAAEFLSELETAYDRFPRSPEITLSLARAYERISRNSTAARKLYSRFIEIAPGHPLIGEAKSALDRLR